MDIALKVGEELRIETMGRPLVLSYQSDGSLQIRVPDDEPKHEESSQIEHLHRSSGEVSQ